MNLVISKILKNGIPDFKKLIDPFIPPESLDELGNSKIIDLFCTFFYNLRQ